MKGFLGVATLGASEFGDLVQASSDYRDAIESQSECLPSLMGRCVANVFFEPSTRTRLSFDLAAQRLGAHVLTFNPGTASTSKGESLRDTVSTLAAIGADILVVRHSEDFVPQRVAEWTGLPVVNAGDGINEHPTQALLDATTLVRHFGATSGLRMVIVGDISHSRVAGSLIHAMPLLGVDVSLAGPPDFLPANQGLEAHSDFEASLSGADIVYMLRVQEERGGAITKDYVRDFQLDRSRLGLLSDGAVVMHAGPLNRGVEIADEVADSPRCLISEQVRNGVPARMAVLSSIARSIG